MTHDPGRPSERRIRVLWLIKGLGLGGAEKLLVNALPYLDRDRFDYEVGYFLPWKDALVAEIEEAGIPVTCFHTRSGLPLMALRRVHRHLVDRRIDVMHAHLPWASIVGRIAARRGRVPAVVYTEHGCWERLNPLTRFVNRRTLPWNDLTIAVSEEVRNSIGNVPAASVRTVTNGIDCARLAASGNDRQGVCGELGISADDFLIIKVANLSPVKRHEVLIEAFARFHQERPRSTLVLAGQLRDRDQMLRGLAEQLGVGDRVKITGPRTDVPRLVGAADLFAISSRSEGLPVSLLEAMSLAKPVVCTAVGGIPGVVRDQHEGLLVPPEQPEAMAAAFKKLMDDARLRDRLGQAGQTRVQEHFDISVMVQTVEDEYRRILEAKSGEGATDATDALRRHEPVS